ncbi:MAG TPA: thiamine pyrophosphate-dependent enzyme [Candidatus Ratteibacteria bacterium]|nr:thiamine pyrophosphate-dependent enzyme [bacterium]HRS06219.1 thiamine pyrophosphate-dependent enzyme [Candidatus Ratteibacteria bacterium]HRV05192.1 thiamine pyrophosphate-dependent enzyme [Candidatus Ratteibacteria bacterium]
MPSIKELAKRKEKFVSGHRLCPGCGAGVVARLVMNAIDKPVVVGCATGCLEVSSTIFPYSSWDTPFIHSAFENAAATVSGVETAYRSLKKQGKIDKDVVFVAFGGDGGTYDIGLQSLSGAAERGHKMLYVCYNNQAYMNTGIQRSSATPKGASTTTSPAGKVIPGKIQFSKDIMGIMIAHNIPYAAQTIPGRWNDITNKVEKAINTDGFSFINVLSPCRLGWPHKPEIAMEITRLAVETCFWPLYEVIDGKYKLNYKPKEKKPIIEWLKIQGRFAHLLKPGNEKIIEGIQQEVDRRWENLLKKCESSA